MPGRSHHCQVRWQLPNRCHSRNESSFASQVRSTRLTLISGPTLTRIGPKRPQVSQSRLPARTCELSRAPPIPDRLHTQNPFLRLNYYGFEANHLVIQANSSASELVDWQDAPHEANQFERQRPALRRISGFKFHCCGVLAHLRKRTREVRNTLKSRRHADVTACLYVRRNGSDQSGFGLLGAREAKISGARRLGHCAPDRAIRSVSYCQRQNTSNLGTAADEGRERR